MIKTCCNLLIQLGIIALIIFPPLAFGAVQPRYLTIIRSIILLLWLVWVLKTFVKGSFTYRPGPADLPLAVFIGLGLLNLLTSTAPHHTEQEFSLLVNYALLYFLLLQHLKTTRRILGLAFIMLLIGSGEALFGLFQYLTGATTVLGVMTPNIGTLNATYINHNHFAGFLILILPLALGLFIGVANYEQKIFLFLIICLMGGALILTLSRGGILSFLLASAGFFACAALKARRAASFPRLVLLPVLAAIVIAIFVGWIGISHISHRSLFETFVPSQKALAEEVRFPLWRNALALVPEFPLTGSGLGTFEYVFLRHRPAAVPQNKHVDHAHNDYLELLIEMGFPALLVVIWGLGRIARRALTAYFGSDNPLLTALLLGGFTGCAAMAIHSVFDFNLRIPANALLTVMVLALTSAALQLLDARHKRAYAPYSVTASWRFAIIALGVAGALGFGFRKNVALAYARRAQIRELQGDLFAPITLYQKAMALDSRNPLWHEKLGSHYFALGHSRPHADKWFALAAEQYRNAGARNRFDPAYFYYLGWAEDAAGRDAEAIQAFEQAVAHSPRVSFYHEALGKFLFSVEQPEAGMRRLQHALELNPGIVRDILDFYHQQNVTYAEYQAFIPEPADLRKTVAEWLNQKGFWAESKREYRKAIAASEGRAAYYDALSEACRQRQDYACLREILGELAARQPENPELLAQIAESYARQHLWDEAVREYEALCERFPEHDGIADRLGQLYRQLERWDDGIRHYQRLLARYPDQGRFYHALAGMYRQQNLWPEAAAVYRNALAAGLTAPDMHAELGIVFEQLGDPAQALTAYDQAVQAGEQRFDIYRRLANLYAQAGQKVHIPVLWSQYVVANNHEPQALFTLAQYYHAQREWLNAVNLTKEVITNAPTQPEYRIFLANLYLEQQMTHEAIAQWERLVTVNAGNVEFRLRLAALYEQSENWGQARTQYRQILRLAPNHQQAQQKLAALGG